MQHLSEHRSKALMKYHQLIGYMTRQQSSLSSIRGKSKFIGTFAGVIIGSGCVVIGYALYNPSFQAKFEDSVPRSKPMFEYIHSLLPIERTERRGKKLDVYIGGFPTNITNWITGTESNDKKQPSILNIPDPPPLPETKLAMEATRIDPVDVLAFAKASRSSPTDMDYNDTRNRELEESLKAALTSATNKVKEVTDTKTRVMSALKDHTSMLMSAVDGAERGSWDKVSAEVAKVEELTSASQREEASARNYLDNVTKIIDDAKQSNETKNNPLLLNAKETMYKLQHQIDQLNISIKKTYNNCTMMSQYKDLVEKSRQHFSNELRSILPRIDVHTKDKRLTEDELNALIAHAHLQVQELKKQLAEQQIQEEQNIARAVDQQRRLDSEIAESEIALKIKEVMEKKDVEIEQEVAEDRRAWEAELEERLQRSAAAYADHLEQVVRTQRQLFDIEKEQKIHETLASQRELHGRQINVAQGRLEGIEEALISRAAVDLEARRMKHVWIVCQNLLDSIVHGRRSGFDMEARRKPLVGELQSIKEVSPEDEFVSCLLHALSEQCIYEGVYTEDDLRARFHKVYKLCRRVSKVDENGGGLLRYLSSLVQNALSFDFPHNFHESDLIDPKAIDTNEILARAKEFVDRDDFASAVKIIQLLRGEPRFVAKDWVKSVRNHLEVRLVAELLVAHAAIANIRAVY